MSGGYNLSGNPSCKPEHPNPNFGMICQFQDPPPPGTEVTDGFVQSQKNSPTNRRGVQHLYLAQFMCTAKNVYIYICIHLDIYIWFASKLCLMYHHI